MVYSQPHITFPYLRHFLFFYKANCLFFKKRKKQQNFYFVLGYSWLTNNVTVSGKQRRDSAINIHVSILPQPLLSRVRPVCLEAAHWTTFAQSWDGGVVPFGPVPTYWAHPFWNPEIIQFTRLDKSIYSGGNNFIANPHHLWLSSSNSQKPL